MLYGGMNMHGDSKGLNQAQNEICYGIKLALTKIIIDFDNEKLWDIFIKNVGEQTIKDVFK